MKLPYSPLQNPVKRKGAQSSTATLCRYEAVLCCDHLMWYSALFVRHDAILKAVTAVDAESAGRASNTATQSTQCTQHSHTKHPVHPTQPHKTPSAPQDDMAFSEVQQQPDAPKYHSDLDAPHSSPL